MTDRHPTSDAQTLWYRLEVAARVIKEFKPETKSLELARFLADIRAAVDGDLLEDEISGKLMRFAPGQGRLLTALLSSQSAEEEAAASGDSTAEIKQVRAELATAREEIDRLNLEIQGHQVSEGYDKGWEHGLNAGMQHAAQPGTVTLVEALRDDLQQQDDGVDPERPVSFERWDGYHTGVERCIEIVESWRSAPADAGDSTADETREAAISLASKHVHNAWMDSKLAQGVTSRRSETGEELMVPYEQLSEAAKDLDRNSVAASYDAFAAADLLRAVSPSSDESEESQR